MRGQESGSEHQREAEGSATPATPPPSFGQPSPHVLRTDLTDDEQPPGPSGWPETAPGAAQPWTVPGDGAPYDWYAQPEDDPPAPWPGPAHPAPQPGPLSYPEPSGPTRPEFSSDSAGPTRPEFPPGPSRDPRPDLPGPPGFPSGPPPGFLRGPSQAPRPEFPRDPSGPPPGLHPQASESLPRDPSGPPGSPSGPSQAPRPEFSQDSGPRPEFSRDPSGPRPEFPAGSSGPRPESSPGSSGPTWSEFSRPEPAPPAWINSPTPPEPSPPAWPTPENPNVSPRPGGTHEGERHEHGVSSPRVDQPLSTAPIVPGAPPWQPPPAFTAAAAGMQVWPSSGQETPWPAATGEPVWTDPEESTARPGEPGDIAVWPPDATPSKEPDESDDTTADVRAAVAGAPGHPEEGDLLASGPLPPTRQNPQQSPPRQEPAQQALAQPSPGQATHQVSVPSPATGPRDESPPAPSGSAPSGLTPSGPAPSGSAPSGPAPGAPPPMAAPTTASMTQPFTRQEPEPISQVPVPPFGQDTRDRTPSEAAQPFPLSDHTPPGGIPVVTGIAPSFPVLPPPPVTSSPVDETAALPESGPATMRGAFTPLSEFTPEPPPSPPEPTRSRASTTLLAAVVAVVVVGIGTGAFFAYQSFSAKQSANATDPIPRSGTLDPTDDLDITGEPEPINTTMLNSEKTDPGTMTVADAFGQKVSVAGTTFKRVKTDVTEQCQKAASGRFGGTLRSQDCRRVLRATYVDSKRKYAVTTGIAVLPTRESAVAADKAKDLDSNLWFRGLPSAAGTGGERVHIAGGYAAGMVWGRYIVFSYATFSDGHTPTAKEKSLGKVSGAFRDQTAKVVERRVTN
ncbi:hypothetical protein [Streptosporangium sp. NPDC000509]|uniref:hypothetical protein n=1 Tax=Streptosporangium sp. NPDC000509 TaxID=3366186 RepID=UPI0036B99F5F